MRLRNRNTKPRSAEQFLHLLPQEIIEEILSRLPVKSLLRFRCVCKSWRSLFDNKQFIKTHLQNSTKNQSFPHQKVILHNLYHWPTQCSLRSLFDESSHRIRYLSCYPFDFKWKKSSRIIGCRNGLICIVEESLNVLTMWNPSTRLAYKLPNITDRKYVKIRYPGFGWIKSSDEYKVFGVVPDPNTRNGKVGKVYSSKTNSWKILEQLDLQICYKPGECVGEKLYWEISEGIATFDLKSEVFRVIEVPFIRKHDYINNFFGVTGAHLGVSLESCGRVIWIMKEYGVEESWESVVASPRHVLDLFECPFSDPSTRGKRGWMLLVYPSNFLAYYPRQNYFFRPRLLSDYRSAYLYIESLVSPVFS